MNTRFARREKELLVGAQLEQHQGHELTSTYSKWHQGASCHHILLLIQQQLGND